MFSKILTYIVLVFSIFLWLQAYSPFIYKSSRFFPDDYRHGDLYRLSYLPQFKEKVVKCFSVPISQKINKPKPTNLFIIGDSFTEAERINKKDFFTEKYQYVHWSKKINVQIDASKRNILVLETIERTFKDHFSTEVDNFQIKDPLKTETRINLTWKQLLKESMDEIIVFCFPKGTEERLEHTLFNYDFFLWIRELKATFNLTFFGRVEKQVILSKDQKHLFYVEEADSTNSHSAFYPLKQSEIEPLIVQINKTRQKYLKAGFDEVYLSVIPNKVSVLSPNLGKYNHLIERIQQDLRVQTPFIDSYSIFKKSPQKYYLKSDTHWNCDGREVWLNSINKILLNP